MRLIDADKLLEHYACGDTTGIPEDDIRLAPTIDAIPVDYIEYEIKRIKKMIEVEKDYATADRIHSLEISWQTLRALITTNWSITSGVDWRKK